MGSDRVLNEGDVESALAAHGLNIDQPPPAAVVLSFTEPLRVVWANSNAARLFGTSDPTDLFAQVFAGRGRDGLAAAVRRLVTGGGAKAERLRLFKGFSSRTLAVTVSRTLLPGGDEVIVLAVPVHEAEPQDRAAFVTSALPMPQPVVSVPAELPLPVHAKLPAQSTASPARLAALGTKRFVWHTDAEGRLLSVSGLPPELRGLRPIPQQSLVEGLAAMGALVDDAFAAALLSPRPWSGLSLAWPLADDSGAVSVTFGGVPIRSAGGLGGGVRGFGVADFTMLVARAQPLMGPSDEAAQSEAVPDQVEAAAAMETADAQAEAPALELPPVGIGPQPDAHESVPAILGPTEPRALFASSKIVALRPFQLLSGASPDPGELAAPPARRHDDSSSASVHEPQRARAADAEPANLSSTEHSNFDEIGRTLKDGLGQPGLPGGRNLAPGVLEPGTATLAALPVALLVTIGGRVVFVSDAFFALSGYTSVAELERAGGLAQVLAGLDPATVADAQHDRSFPIIDAAGQVLAVEGRAATLPWGDATALVLTFRPAGDRIVETEGLANELRRRGAEAAETRTLLDRVSDAVAVVDGQGRLLMLNATGESLFGRPEAGVLGESVGALLSSEAQSAALGAVLAASGALPGSEPGSIAVSGRHPGGGTLSLSMTPRTMGPGKVGVILRDQGEMEGLRRDLRRARAELDHAAGLRSDVLARINHEIRTPLNAILGFAEIILDERFGPIGNPRYKDYMTDIHAAGQHVIDFVGDLVDLSKMQAGRLDLSVAAVDVNRIVSETVGEIQSQAHRDRVIVRLSLLPHLPSALVDEKALRQIMTNILSNGIAFNEPGGQVIVSTAVTDGDAVAVRVRDTGVGMTDAELATVMEPFRQISMGKPATSSGGGLGLPLTRALVEANQATMSIRSRKNEGTLVEVVLRPATAVARSVPAA